MLIIIVIIINPYIFINIINLYEIQNKNRIICSLKNELFLFIKMIAILDNTRIEIFIVETYSLNIKSDAIVIFNSRYLDLSIGLTGKLMKHVNRDEILSTEEKSLQLGNAIISPIQNLPKIDYLINAISIDEKHNQTQKLAIFAQSFSSSLDLAYRNGLKSITFSYFPEYLTKVNIGTLSNVFFKIILAYLKKRPFINKIILLAESQYDYDIHSNNLKSLIKLY